MRPSSRIRADEVEALTKFGALVLLLAVTASRAWSADAAPKNIGFVLGVSGQCFQNGSTRPLVGGQRLPAGAILRFPPQYKNTDFVEIALRDGTKLPVHCSEPRVCDAPIRLPTATQTNGIMQTILDSLRPEVGYVTPISRGVARYVVLQYDQGQIDFAPLFGNAAPGVYTLVLERIKTDTSEPFREPVTATLAWQPGVSRVAVPGPEPGLFEVTVPNLEIDHVAALIVPSEDYLHDTQAIEDASSLAQQLAITSSSRQTFLRAFLASLAARRSQGDR